MKTPRIIVIGNEKGGSGKSTTAVHLAVSQLLAGRRVACLDLDMRQKTMSRYFGNRRAYGERHATALAMPTFMTMADAPEAAPEAALGNILAKALSDHDLVVIDAPGADTAVSRAALAFADVLVTPLNDSFVDLDVLAHVDPETGKIISPSHYAETVWQQKLVRAQRDGGSIDWVVMRNRLGHSQALNRRAMKGALDELAGRIGFRQVGGFAERVVFRELFLDGLTILDLAEIGRRGLAMSHIAARQEIRHLLSALNLPVAG